MMASRPITVMTIAIVNWFATVSPPPSLPESGVDDGSKRTTSVVVLV